MGGCGNDVGTEAVHWIPAFAGMTGVGAGVTGAEAGVAGGASEAGPSYRSARDSSCDASFRPRPPSLASQIPTSYITTIGTDTIV